MSDMSRENRDAYIDPRMSTIGQTGSAEPPHNPPAGTPNAVEEAREALPPFLPPMPSLKDLRGLVVMMVEDYEDGELFGSAKIVDALIAAVRTQAFADVRRMVEELDDFYSVEYGDVTDKRVVYLAELTAGLDALERGP